MNTTATLNRTATWDYIGMDFNTSDITEVLTNSGLNYTVEPTDTYIKFDNKEILVPGKKTIVRNDGHIYGIVSENYKPVQNADAFDFIKYIDENITFVKAGETYNGLVYIIGKLEDVNILGDTFTPHVIFQNSHNGGYSLATNICPLRIVCQNQFNIAFKESNSTFIIKHTKNAESKMALAAETLKNISSYMKIFTKKAELFAANKVNDSQVTKFINYMFPIKDNMTDKAIEKLEEEKTKFIKAYQGEDNSNFRGSAWGLINGLTDYITHKEYKRKVENANEKRFIDTIMVANTLNHHMEFLSSMISA